MKWSYILYLPAIVSVVWALVTVILKRRLTIAQVLLSLMLLLVGFTITVLGVFFRGRAGSLFIYHFVFESVAMFCGPMFYIGVCSLTGPRGATLRQRQVFIIPLLFVVGLTVGAFTLGPRRYENMCQLIREQCVGWIDGDSVWNFMLFWCHPFFQILLLVFSFILLLVASHKALVYQRRFNSFYAEGINVPKINSRPLLVTAWAFLPLGVLTVLAVNYQPYYYKYWLIVLSLLLSVLQFFVGRYIFKLNYDARHLVQIIKE